MLHIPGQILYSDFKFFISMHYSKCLIQFSTTYLKMLLFFCDALKILVLWLITFSHKSIEPYFIFF